jgi:DUF4097 and DUF4098 domain-containing protein YvlB
MRTRVRPFVRLMAAAAVALALPACEVNLNTEGLTVREKRTFTVTGQPDLTLETFDGAIEIHSWDRSDIEVEIEKRGMEQAQLDEMVIEADQQGDKVVLRVKGPAAAERRGVTIGMHISPAARLLVAVPRKSLIDARTADGSIRVENIEGRLTIRTGDGNVTLERIVGAVEARSGDGSIRVESAEGPLDVETDDGNVTIEAKPSVLRARTGDGTIRIQVQPDSSMTGAWDISSGDGSITLLLPTPFNAEIDAETSDGSVRSSYPGLQEDGDGEDRARRRSLRARLGDGGQVLKVRTGDGTIRFER